jgi:hypothetical protein
VLVRQILEMALLGAFPDLARTHVDPLLDGWAQRVRVHKAFEPDVMTTERMRAWCVKNRYVCGPVCLLVFSSSWPDTCSCCASGSSTSTR